MVSRGGMWRCSFEIDALTDSSCDRLTGRARRERCRFGVDLQREVHVADILPSCPRLYPAFSYRHSAASSQHRTSISIVYMPIRPYGHTLLAHTELSLHSPRSLYLGRGCDFSYLSFCYTPFTY